MGSFTDYLKNQVISHIFGRATFSPPTLYLGLSTSPPGNNGEDFNEPSGSGYQRLATTPADWTDAQAGCVGNVTRLCLNMSLGSWGTVTHFGLFDAPQAGHLLLGGQLEQPITVGPGAIVNFEPGQLCVSLV